jgi:uncharacterized protein
VSKLKDSVAVAGGIVLVIAMATAAPGISAPLLTHVMAAGNAQDSAEQVAASVVNDLVNGRFADVTARFSPDVAKALPVAQLAQIWSTIIRQGGAVREVAPAQHAQVANNVVLVVPIKLERVTVDLRLTVAGDKIAGIFFTPDQPQQIWTVPTYADPAKFTSTDVTIGAGPTALGGTLALPKSASAGNKVPAVVLVHGSGPGDRDESLGPNRPFRDLAEGLATRGIAVLRYDKRTKVHPEQFGPTSTVREEVIDDARAAVALFSARPDIDLNRVIVVGHSLGAMLAPRIAEGRQGVAAIVMLAPGARPLPLLMVEQAEYIASLHGPIDEDAKKRLDALKAEAASAMAAKADDVGQTMLGVPAPYWADLNDYDPAAAAARLMLPTLIVRGGRDYQVTAVDLARFKAALAGRRNVTIRELPNLNHLLMAGEGKSQPEEYQRLDHVDPAVIAAIAAFLAGLPE